MSLFDGVTEEDGLVHFVASGRPKVKGRPRMTRSGRAYTPQETKLAEAALADQYTGPKLEGPIEVTVRYYQDRQEITISPADLQLSKLRGDVDNYLKLTLDALNGVAWVDDKQVVAVTAEKCW